MYWLIFYATVINFERNSKWTQKRELIGKKELNSPLLDLFWLPVAVVVPPVWPFEVPAYVV